MNEIFIYDKKVELCFIIFMYYEACISYSINHVLFFIMFLPLEKIYNIIFVVFWLTAKFKFSSRQILLLRFSK